MWINSEANWIPIFFQFTHIDIPNFTRIEWERVNSFLNCLNLGENREEGNAQVFTELTIPKCMF